MDFQVFFGFIFLSLISGLLGYFLSWILRYKSKNKSLNSNYECDFEAFNGENVQFRANFLPYCICFLLFVTQCVLMFPFAYIKGVLDIFYCLEIMIFILILILILLFSIKSGLLKINDKLN